MNPSLRSLSTSPAGQPAGLPYPEPPASSIVRTCDCRRSSAGAPNLWRPRMDASSSRRIAARRTRPGSCTGLEHLHRGVGGRGREEQRRLAVAGFARALAATLEQVVVKGPAVAIVAVDAGTNLSICC